MITLIHPYQAKRNLRQLASAIDSSRAGNVLWTDDGAKYSFDRDRAWDECVCVISERDS